MPQILRVGPYVLYFWSNESDPLECIHIHIAEGRPSANATKIWITSTGKTIVCNNNSNILEITLHRLMRIIEANADYIKQSWLEHFGEISFYC